MGEEGATVAQADEPLPQHGEAAQDAGEPRQQDPEAPGKTGQSDDAVGAPGKTGQSDDDVVEAEELLVHIKGIKFQQPGAGVGSIAKQLAAKGGKFASVGEKRVRRLMKKHGLLQSQLEEDNKKAGVIKLYSVGEASKPHVPKQPPAAAKEVAGEDWVVVELNVPASRGGDKKYQATISLEKRNSAASAAGPADTRIGAVYKLQAVAGDLDAKFPMLLYNESKSQRTYVHPDAPGHRQLYERLREQSEPQGSTRESGLKGFFYGKQSREVGKHFILLNLRTPAPWQAW